MNFGGKGETTATLKAVYSGDTLYMLVQYRDPTDSRRRGPYQKQADGSWKKLVDPADEGGDDNVYYEDTAHVIVRRANVILYLNVTHQKIIGERSDSTAKAEAVLRTVQKRLG